MPPPSIAHMGIYIDRSPQDVFDYVMDIARTPEWRPRMSSVEWVTPEPHGLGSRFRVDVRSLGYTFHFEVTITEWDPPRYIAYEGDQGPVSVRSFMEWFPDGDGCRFFVGGEPDSKNWFVRMLRPAFEYSVLKQNLGDFERLKTIMESGADRRESDRRTPRAGDVITNPVYGDTVRWLQIGSDSSPTRFELIVYPHASGPPTHIHPRSYERFEVLSGAVRLRMGREDRIVGSGETVTVPPRTIHTWHNHTDQPATVIAEMDPGFGFARFIDEWYEMARKGRLDSKGDLGLFDTATIFEPDVIDAIAMPRIPLGLQKALFRGIRRLGRLRARC